MLYGYINNNLIHVFNPNLIPKYGEIGIIEKVKAFQFSDANGVRVNTAIYFRTPTILQQSDPIYVDLNFVPRLYLFFRFRKLWVQQGWFYIMSISIFALVLSAMDLCMNYNRVKNINDSDISVQLVNDSINTTINRNTNEIQQASKKIDDLKSRIDTISFEEIHRN